VALLARDSGASILDLEYRRVTTAPGTYLDGGLRRRVQKRVLDQDPAELERAQLVGLREDGAVEASGQRVPGRRRHRAELLDQVACQRTEVDGLAVNRESPCVEPGQVEQVRGELGQAVDLLAHGGEEFPSRRLVQVLVVEELEEAAEREE